MKNRKTDEIKWRSLLAIALAAVIGFSMIACDVVTDEDKSGGDSTTFTGMEAFNKWLEKQSPNTPDTPYRVKLTLNDGSFGGHSLRYFGNGGKYVHLDISDSTITSIGEEAFTDCDTLVGITIGNSVKSIGRKAFSGSGLIGIIIPSSVTDIGSSAFYSCRSLISATIPDSVTNIGDYAFYESGLTSVTIPNGVTKIGTQVFWQCRNLTNVNIPNSVVTIGRLAFQYCVSLTGVTLPNSVITIDGGAFSGCTSLTGITIPGSVTAIEEGAFSGCTGLASVTFQGTINSGNFNGTAFDDWLSDKFYATDTTNGTPGTYTRNGSNWTKQ